jgi:hypothetical protein
MGLIIEIGEREVQYGVVEGQQKLGAARPLNVKNMVPSKSMR